MPPNALYLHTTKDYFHGRDRFVNYNWTLDRAYKLDKLKTDCVVEEYVPELHERYRHMRAVCAVFVQG